MFKRFFQSHLTHCFLLGALMVLALPPFHVTPLYWFCFPAFLILLNKTESKRGAFFKGWLFGLGYFVFGLYWICVALTTDIKSFWWAMPFALFGLPLYFSIYWGLGALISKMIVRRFFPKNQFVALIFLCPLLLFIGEVARGHLLTGFPWNPIGSGWTGWLPVLQIISVIGIQGLSLLTMIIASLPALFFVWPRRKAAVINAIGIALFVVIGIWGYARLQANPTAFVQDIKIRLVQPNIPQGEKWEDPHACA